MKKLLIMLFGLLLFNGCAGREAPCINELWHIHVTHYVSENNDCCEYSVNYCNILLACGIEAYVVVGDVRQYIEPHAWVMIIDNKIEYFVDPTWSLQYKPATQWRDRSIEYIFNQGVTPDELRHYRNILERRR
jgi:hypothetical protein